MSRRAATHAIFIDDDVWYGVIEEGAEKGLNQSQSIQRALTDRHFMFSKAELEIIEKAAMEMHNIDIVLKCRCLLLGVNHV